VARKIILFELNEVPWRVIDAFCETHPRSSFAHLLPRSRQLSTFAADTEPLHPWCTWPTVHRGVSNEIHGIDHFGQDQTELDRSYPPIWQLLEAANLRVGVFGSLHTYPLPQDPERYAFFVPDTFAKGDQCHPTSAAAFQRFNLSMARASARNVSSSIDLPAAVSFLARAPALGVRPTTLFSVASQLLSERREPSRRVRRRSFQSVLAFDLYAKLLRKTRPDFSTFFSNHVASSQHRYWAARFPEDYDDLGFDDEWIQRWSGEIDFSMQLADDFLRRLVRFVDSSDDYALIVSSSMGQAAYHSQPIKSQLYLRDVARFMSAAGVPDGAWERLPAMDPDVALRVDPESLEPFRHFLGGIMVADRKPSIEYKDAGFVNVAFGQRNLEGEIDLRVHGEPVAIEALGLLNEKIDDQAASSGNHVPEGCFLIYSGRDGTPVTSREIVSTLEIAPFLLSHFGVPIPDYMRAAGAIAPI
jgi:hypothetical protein